MTDLKGDEGAAAPAPGTQSVSPVTDREQARKRLEAKRDLVNHVVAYVVINAFLVLVWAFTGAGYFWPGWVIGGWGVGLVFHVWDTFYRRPITDADIDKELQRGS
jgi:hypothetical protein